MQEYLGVDHPIAGFMEAGNVHQARADLRFADAPFWQYVPTRSALLFAVKDLNGDERPDVLLYHSTAVTILVSAQ